MSSAPLQTRLRSLLRKCSTQSDSLITHLARVFSTSSGIEASLCTVYYTLILLHSQLTRILAHRYEKFAMRLASAASETMLPGEALVAAIEPQHLRLSEACASVKAGANAVQDARIFLRLWGLLRIYMWAKRTYVHPPRDAIIKMLVWMQAGVTVGFQALDNGACLIGRGVLGNGSEKWAVRENKWWVRSNRFWMARVVLEMLRLLRVRQLRFNEEFGAEQKEDRQEEKVTVQSKELEKRWQRDLYSNAGWFAPTLHRSMYDESQSPVSEAWMGLSGMIPGVLAFQDVWRETA